MRVRKMVVDRIRSVGEVRAALEAFRAQGVAGFGKVYDPILADRPRPDIQPILGLTDELLAHTLDTYVRWDMALQRSTSEDAGLPTDQKDLMSRLGGKILRLRHYCLAHLDPATVARVGLDEAIARTPDGLNHQSNLIHDHLTAPDLTLPEDALSGEGTDPKALAAFLEPERTELAEIVATLREERKMDELAAIGKETSRVEHDRLFRRVVRFLHAAFRLAGEDELAERLKPAVRRISHAEEKTEEPPASEPPAAETDLETEVPAAEAAPGSADGS